MKVVHPICCGMDVHKEDVKVCVVWRDEREERCEEVRTFSTMTEALLRMVEWVSSYGCKVVAIESTGSYWKPVFNILEGDFEVMLVNPGHLKYVEGFKTDAKDARWLAGLLEHGLLTCVRGLRYVRAIVRAEANARVARLGRVTSG